MYILRADSPPLNAMMHEEKAGMDPTDSIFSDLRTKATTMGFLTISPELASRLFLQVLNAVSLRCSVVSSSVTENHDTDAMNTSILSESSSAISSPDKGSKPPNENQGTSYI